jgi:hypothetical protein
MASIATENVKLGEEKRAQEYHEKEIMLSGEQEEHKRRNAQNVLNQLKMVVVEGEIPGTEALSDACLKAEQLLIEQAQSPSIDPETRKLLEDIAQLCGSAKQVARHNDLGDRLNRIAEETKKALAAAGKAGASSVPAASVAASKQVVDLIATWRPLFLLLVRSKDFRVLIVDAIKISQRIFGRHTEGLGEKTEQKFLEGENVVQIAKEVGQEAKANSKDSQTGEYQVAVTDEEWNQIQDDFFRVLRTLSSQPNYQEGVQWLFNLLDLAYDQLKAPVAGKATIEIHAQRARAETADLIGSIAGKEVFESWVASLKNLVGRFETDERTKQFLKEFREFILKTKDAANVNKEEYKRKGRELISQGRELIKELKYSEEVDAFFNLSNELATNIRNDETMTVLSHHAGIVASDLSFVDKEGSVQVDMEMLGKLREVIVPVLAESLKYIPLPKIEDSNESRDYWVDNIVLCGYDIIPDNVRFQIQSDSQLSLRDAKTQHSDTRLVITLAKIRTELKNLEFFYHKKTFPELTEQGRATVRIGGAGATLKLVFAVQQNADDKVPKLTEGYADFHISKMEIDFDKKSLTHDILVPLMTGMWNLQIQAQIEKAVEDNLTSIINNIADKLTSSLVAINRPFMAGVDQLRDVVGQKEFAKAYQNRIEKLE